MRTQRSFYNAVATLVFFLLCTSGNLLAQSESVADVYDLSLEQLLNVEVTTATKTKGSADLAPSVMDVITGEQIHQRGYQHLGQLLNDIADNHEDKSNWGIGEPVSQNVGFGFRFDTGQNILILYNGQRINAFLPGNRFGGEEYLLSNIERIEIIRGPGSALYGTSAFTAVINIISKKAEAQKDYIQIGAEYTPTSNGIAMAGSLATTVGTKGSLTGAFRYFTEQGQSLNVESRLFENQTVSDGVDFAVDGEVYFNEGTFNLYSKFTRQQRNTFTGFNSVSPSDMDELKLSMNAYSLGTDKTFQLSERTSLKFSVGWHQDNWTEVALIPQFKLNIDGTQLELDENGSPVLEALTLYRNGEFIQTSFFIDGQGADTQSLDGELQFTINYRRNNHLVFGAYVADDRILQATRPTELNLSPLGFVPFREITDHANNWLFDVNASRQTAAFYGQTDYDITTNLTLSGGARLDHYSGKGILEDQRYTEFNPRVGLVYSHKDAGAFKLLYGTATRIPNGFETLSAVTLIGNPANRPERINTLQLQWIVNWTDDLRMELGGFTTSIDNRLETNAEISGELKAQGFVGQFVNVGDKAYRNNGIDGKVIGQVNSVIMMLNFTQYFGSDDGRGNSIAYIPNTMINGDVNIPFGWFNLNTGFNYRSKFTKASGDLRDPVKSYFVGRVNLTAAPRKSPITFKLTLRNIFNTTYLSPSSSQDFVKHFPTRGVELIIGGAYRFK